MKQILEGVDTVYLTAAMARVQPSIKDPISFNNVNVGGVLNVLEACRHINVRRVVYSASSSAYGNTTIFPTPETAPTNPLSPYGLQKYIGEQYCTLYSQLYGLDTVSLRYFNVYGEGMPLEGAYRTVISIFGEQYRKGEPLTYTNDGEQRRDFTYVGDVVAANILAGDSADKLNGEVFNVGNGSNFSVNEVIAMFGSDSKFIESRIEPSCTLADNSKLRARFGWKPTGHLPSFIEQYKKFLLSL
jgi:UDP-glucose 4-epimerase